MLAILDPENHLLLLSLSCRNSTYCRECPVRPGCAIRKQFYEGDYLEKLKKSLEEFEAKTEYFPKSLQEKIYNQFAAKLKEEIKDHSSYSYIWFISFLKLGSKYSSSKRPKTFY